MTCVLLGMEITSVHVVFRCLPLSLMKQALSTCSLGTSRTGGGLESNYYFGLCNGEAGFIITRRGGGIGGS